MKLKESWKLLRQQVASSATSIPSGATVICKEAVSPPIATVTANVNWVMPTMDGCSNDKILEGVVISYKEKICILTSELDALKKKLILEQEWRRNVES
jgi:hypothetical protein